MTRRSVSRAWPILAWAVTLPTWADPVAGSTAPGEARPLAFVENAGQWPSEVHAIVRRGPLTAYLEQRGFLLELRGSDESGLRRGAAVRFRFAGAREDTGPCPAGPPTGRHSFLVGDASRHRCGVEGYGSYRYRGLYDGVDLVLRSGTGLLEYDLLLDPGADLGQVVVHCTGANGLFVERDGTLAIETSLGILRQPPPTTWEIATDGSRRHLEARFRILDDGRFGFEAPERDASLPLVVDPGLEWSTFLGGSGEETLEEIATDPATGETVVVGTTFSPSFPTTAGVFDVSRDGGSDTYVARLSADGSALVWSTLIGGSGTDAGTDLALHPNGDVTVVGSTGSSDFPTTPGAYFSGGFPGGFIARLDPSGGSLVSSTYLPGAAPLSVGIDADGDTVVCGFAFPHLPATPGAFDTSYGGGGTDAFVARLDSTLSALVFATFLGGSCAHLSEVAYQLDLAPGGGIVVSGITCSPDFPTTPGALDSSYGGPSTGVVGDAFVSMVSADGSTLLYSTYVGGSAFDQGYAIDVEEDGRILVAGQTDSVDFPTTPNAFDSAYAGGVEAGDAFFMRLDPSGSGAADLLYSTYLGGLSNDHVHDVLGDGGIVNLVGSATSVDFPTTPGAVDVVPSGSEDVFFSRFDTSLPPGDQLLYSTVLGGSDRSAGHRMTLPEPGAVIIAGPTHAPDFPVTPGAHASVHGGSWDGYVSRIDFSCTGSFSSIGSGTPGTGGFEPRLSAQGCPTIGSTTSIEVYFGLGGAVGLVGVGTTPTAISAFGGTLHLLPTLFVPVVLGGAPGQPGLGAASLPFSIGPSPSLVGAHVLFQAGFLDPGAPSGVTLSAGLDARIG